MLFERAALPATNRTDPERIANGSFDKFCRDVEDRGLHLGQCALLWLEGLTVSEDATYLTEPWAKEFLDVVTNVVVLHERSLLDRVKAVFNDSFMSAEPLPIVEVEVISHV